MKKKSLSCPYGPKLIIHVGNWAEALCYIYSVMWAPQKKIELRPPRHEMTLTGKFILEVPRIPFKHVLFYLSQDLGAIVLLNILHRHKVDYKTVLCFPQQLSNRIFTFSFTFRLINSYGWQYSLLITGAIVLLNIGFGSLFRY